MRAGVVHVEQRRDADREHAVRVRAARLVVKLSGKLGRAVDPEVARLAAEPQPRRLAG